MNFIDQATTVIKQAGHKMTLPRLAVLNILNKAKSPLSAYEIEKQISSKNSVNVVTIYRIIELFEELKIIHRIMSKQGYMRCDFNNQKGCHHFMVCKKCDEANEFVDQKNCSKEIEFPKKSSFKTIQHISEYIGLCQKCI